MLAFKHLSLTKTARCSLILWLISVSHLWAQIGGGSIVGTVRDPSGAAVAGVVVESHNQDTNETQRAVTNREGYYEFPLLPAGRYRLEGEPPGFDRVLG